MMYTYHNSILGNNVLCSNSISINSNVGIWICIIIYNVVM